MVLIWMTIIFILSSQPADQSGNLSMGVTEFIIRPATSTDAAVTNRLNHMVRKNAHLFTYLILGILVMNAVRRSGMSGYGAITVSLGICVLYAISDELHQLFVAGRGAQTRDVLIDCTGALLGISLYGLVVRVGKR